VPQLGTPFGSIEVVPNPGTDVSYVRFTLSRATTTAAEVFDVSGTRVRLLASGLREAGDQSVAWDGRNDAGRKVPAGVYLVRITTPAGETSGRVVLTR
jgi:flagellar hook assembly protein FlgD